MCEHGRAATCRAWRNPLAHNSAFGLKTRQQLRENKKRAFQEEVAHLAQDRGPCEGGINGGSANDQLALLPASVADIRGRAGGIALARASTTMTDISRCCLLEQRSASHREALAACALEKYEAGVGHAMLERTAESMQSVSARMPEFKPVPQKDHDCLEWRPTEVRSRVLDAMKLNSRCQASKLLAPALHGAWESLHHNLQSEPKVREMLKAIPVRRRLCHDAGCCVCDGEGSRVLSFTRALDKMMRLVFKPHSSARSALAQGEVFFLFHGRRVQPCPLAEVQTSPAEVAADIAPVILLGHAALQELNRWETYWQEAFVDVGVVAPDFGLPMPCSVRMSCVFKSKLDFFAGVDLTLKWSFTPYRCALTSAMIGSFLPAVQVLQFMPGDAGESRVFWDPSRNRAKRRRLCGWASVLAAQFWEDEPAADENLRDAPASDSPHSSEDSAAEGEVEADDSPEFGAFPSETDDEPIKVGEFDTDVLEEFGVTLDDLLIPSDDPADGEFVSPGVEDVAGDGRPSDIGHEPTSTSSSRSSSASSSTSSSSSSRVHATDDQDAHLCIRINEFGSATLYMKGDRNQVLVHCSMPGHGSLCRLSRTLRGNDRPGREGQGRPIGLAAAWILSATAASHPTREMHLRFRPNLAQRQAAREFFSTLPHADPFFRAERPPRQREPLEPERVP